MTKLTSRPHDEINPYRYISDDFDMANRIHKQALYDVVHDKTHMTVYHMSPHVSVRTNDKWEFVYHYTLKPEHECFGCRYAVVISNGMNKTVHFFRSLIGAWDFFYEA